MGRKRKDPKRRRWWLFRPPPTVCHLQMSQARKLQQRPLPTFWGGINTGATHTARSTQNMPEAPFYSSFPGKLFCRYCLFLRQRTPPKTHALISLHLPPFFPRHFISGGVFANAPPPPPLLPLSLIMWKPAQLHLCLMCAVLYTALQLIVVFLLPLSSSFPFWRKSQKIVPPFLSPLSFLFPPRARPPDFGFAATLCSAPKVCARLQRGKEERKRGGKSLLMGRGIGKKGKSLSREYAGGNARY